MYTGYARVFRRVRDPRTSSDGPAWVSLRSFAAQVTVSSRSCPWLTSRCACCHEIYRHLSKCFDIDGRRFDLARASRYCDLNIEVMRDLVRLTQEILGPKE